MEKHNIATTAIKVGLCEYNAIKEYRIFVCQSDIFPGTGDYEDDEEIREDREILCYCVWFEDLLTKGKISSGGGYFLSLTEAIEYSEQTPGFKHWIS